MKPGFYVTHSVEERLAKGKIVKAAARLTFETEEALAWRATQEVEAFHELYRRYALPVYWYHVAWRGNAHTAQSLTSQTFFEAYSQLIAYQLGGLFILGCRWQ